MDECGDLAEFDDSPLSLSLINFSFKVSQLNSLKWNNVAIFYIFSVAPAASFHSISSELRIITCKKASVLMWVFKAVTCTISQIDDFEENEKYSCICMWLTAIVCYNLPIQVC